MGTWTPGVPYTDPDPDQITEEVNGDRDNDVDATVGQPRNPNGMAVRPNVTALDAWLAKVQTQVDNPTPATPLRILTIGSSISSINRPAYTGAKPWPLYLDVLGAAGDNGWRHAVGDADTVNMDATTGTVESATTAGWGASLDVGEYCQLGVADRHLHIVWSRKPGGGDIEVRSGSVGGTVLATIDTDGTAKSGCSTDLELTPNFGTVRLDTLFFVAAGANAVLDGVVRRSSTSTAQVVNASHSGYTTLNHSSAPSRALDYIEQSDPDVTIIMHGTNDGPSTVDTRLRALVEAVQARSDNLIVLVGEPLTSLSNTFTRAMSDIVREIAEDYGCLFVDVAAAMPSFNSLHSGDALHPAESGHRAIAALVGGALRGDPIGNAHGHASRALGYVPATAARWPRTPMTTAAALDHLASTALPMQSLEVIPAATSVTTGDGKYYFRVPSYLNGRNLIGAAAAVFAPSSSGTPTIQIARGRQSSATAAHTFADMLSTRITIDVNEYDSRNATAAAVINTSNDDVATGDLIRVDVDTAGTGTTGLFVTLEFAG